jgi:hypothetical protein
LRQSQRVPAGAGPSVRFLKSTALECSDLSELSFSPTVYFSVSVGCLVDVIVKESGDKSRDESPHSKIYVPYGRK